MKFHLRNLALGAALVATSAMFAEDATVTMKWRHAFNSEHHDVRNGNAYNGKIYFSDGSDNTIKTLDENGKIETYYQFEASPNRGFTIDDAGNILVIPAWPSSANNCSNWTIIKAADKTAVPFIVDFPSEFGFVRTDFFGRTVGDVFSEEGGICYVATNTKATIFPLWILQSEGELIQMDNQIGSYEGLSTQSNQSYAVPSFASMSEFMEAYDENDEAHLYSFYARAHNSVTNIEHPVLDEESGNYAIEKIILPTDLPEGYTVKQLSFETFKLGENRYFCVGVSPEGKNWGSNFCIYDETGHVIFVSDHGLSADTNPYNGEKLHGSTLVARVKDENTVELYQIYATQDSNGNKAFGALFEVTIDGEGEGGEGSEGGEGGEDNTPVDLFLGKDVSVRSGFPTSFTQFAYADGKYTVDFTGGTFVINESGVLETEADIDAYYAGLYGIEGDYILTPGTYSIAKDPNTWCNEIAEGTYTLTVDLTAGTLTIEGEKAPFKAPELYLAGEMTEWEFLDQYKLVSDYEIVDNYVTYTLEADSLSGRFQFADSEWNFRVGTMGEGITAAGEYDLSLDGNDINWKADSLRNIKLTLKLAAVDTLATTLVVEGEIPAPVIPATRKALAYELKAVAGENGEYTITYKSTCDAKAAALVLTDAEGVESTIELPTPVKGENTATVNLADKAEGKYSWAINITSESEADGIVFSEGKFWGEGVDNRGGVVFMSDTDYDSYGYIVIGMGKAAGYAVYTPEGELVNQEMAHVGESNTGNMHSTFRGDDLRDKAVFADWSDAYSGYWVINPLNLDEPRYNMLLPEGATQDKSGAVTYNDVQTGSGSCTVAFYGKGEETIMYGFDEDIYDNQVVMYNLGTANYIMEAPVLSKVGPYTYYGLNIDIEPADANHIWVCAGRANGNEGGSLVALAYYEISKSEMTDDDGETQFVYSSEQLWSSSGLDLFEDGTNGAFAVSPDGKTIVADSQNGNLIYVLDVTTNEYDEPEVALNRTFERTPIKSSRGQMKFDAAGNLHYLNSHERQYQVWSFQGESVATTAAKTGDVIAIGSGVEDLNAAENAAVEYYNLNGVRVATENLTPGIYVRRQGATATKVLVK